MGERKSNWLLEYIWNKETWNDTFFNETMQVIQMPFSNSSSLLDNNDISDSIEILPSPMLHTRREDSVRKTNEDHLKSFYVILQFAVLYLFVKYCCCLRKRKRYVPESTLLPITAYNSHSNQTPIVSSSAEVHASRTANSQSSSVTNSGTGRVTRDLTRGGELTGQRDLSEIILTVPNVPDVNEENRRDECPGYEEFAPPPYNLVKYFAKDYKE